MRQDDLRAQELHVTGSVGEGEEKMSGRAGPHLDKKYLERGAN